MLLTDKVALITGAARGIGRAVALELARTCNVAVNFNRSASEAEELVKEIEAASEPIQ